MKGKTIVMLVNDPPVPDPANASQLDPKTFGGRAMTYYGRWTYKYEIGAEKGAAGVLIIHETEPAGYPFEVLQGGNLGEKLDLVTPDKNMGRANIEGWITVDQGREILQMAGQDFDELKKQAATRDFKPVPLGLTASISLKNKLRTMASQNVVAKLEGRDPQLKNEYVIYTAHWDHLGVGPAADGDRIYNGAVDNAVGTAGIVEIARAFTKLPTPPKRSVLFLAVTAEEQGLLGSQYYAVQPIYPLAKTAAVVNLDTLNVHGRTQGPDARRLRRVRSRRLRARRRGRAGPGPPAGSRARERVLLPVRSFQLREGGRARAGSGRGGRFRRQAAGVSVKVRSHYTEHDYHKPSDIVRPDWDMSGAREDLKVFFAVGYRVAEADKFPEWKPGNEFRAKREAALKK